MTCFFCGFANAFFIGLIFFSSELSDDSSLDEATGAFLLLSCPFNKYIASYFKRVDYVLAVSPMFLFEIYFFG